MTKKLGFLLHLIKLEEDKVFKIALPGYPKRDCQMRVERAEKTDD